MARVAIIGAGVSGLTCAVAMGERGHTATIFADEIPKLTTSAVAAAIWYPYDAFPAELVNMWALVTYGRLLQLARIPQSGVSLVDFQYLSRFGDLEVPSWANVIGYRRIIAPKAAPYLSGFSILAPLMDTSRYLDFLTRQVRDKFGNDAFASLHLSSLDEFRHAGFDLIVNCSGYGARKLVPDAELEPHWGQVVQVEKVPGARAFVLDEPLTYVIPRDEDCILGGVNTIRDCRDVDHDATRKIVERCSQMLGLTTHPKIINELAGIRPFRAKGVYLLSEV